MNEIWLVRHGETEWSRSGQHTGRTDIPLTDLGQQQASGLATILAAQSFDLVLTSPLQRASETARLAGMAGAEPCPDLMEWDYGDLESLTSIEIRKRVPDWTVWSGEVPNGESLAQVQARAEAVLARCGEGRIALFSHGHMLRALTACWLGLPAQAGRLLALGTASISVLGWEHGTAVIRSWNLSAQAPPAR